MNRIHTRGGPEKIQNILKSAGYDPQLLSRQHPSGPEAWLTPPTNYIGTILFLGYIAVALLLIFFILAKDIFPRWSALKDGRSGRVHMLTALASISLSVLAFNMMSFLLQSFFNYLRQAGKGVSLDQIWPWLLNSSLFYDFAKNLLVDQDVVAWSRQCLFMTMIIGAEISYLGRQYSAKNLWAYFSLAQILPPTFSYYLLQLRTALPAPASWKAQPEMSTPPTTSKQGYRTMLPLLTILLVTAISIFKLDLASATDSTCVILLKVLWVRLLLFMPLFLDTSCVFGLSSARLLVAQQWLLASIVVILSNIGSDWPTDLYDHLLNFSKAGFSNPAIQTLSCDWSIKCVGDLLLKLLEGVES